MKINSLSFASLLTFGIRFLLLAMLVWACSTPKEQETQENSESNPPLEGFDLAGSDSSAMQIADQVMEAIGGRKNWDQTRYFHWNFFGARQLLWDKQENRIRVEYPKENLSIYCKIGKGNLLTGKVWKDGELVTDTDSIKRYLEQGRQLWVNDSYWLFMPFRLKDNGVTLKQTVGEFKSSTGRPIYLLELLFKTSDGNPGSKHVVAVDQQTNLITEWTLYRSASDRRPVLTVPFDDYQPYGNILLSGKRGERQITDIRVFDKLSDEFFTEYPMPTLPPGK